MPERQYEVSVHNFFNAISPEDAVLQMASWLAENAYQAGYRVDIGSETLFIDVEELEHQNDGEADAG